MHSLHFRHHHPQARFHNHAQFDQIMKDLDYFSTSSWKCGRYVTKRDAALDICRAAHPSLVYTSMKNELCVSVRLEGPYQPAYLQVGEK
jgi:hypothetical protein